MDQKNIERMDLFGRHYELLESVKVELIFEFLC